MNVEENLMATVSLLYQVVINYQINEQRMGNNNRGWLRYGDF